MFNRLRNIGFTKQDITIISFLLLCFIAGLIIKYSAWKPARDYNYLASDKEFEQSIKTAFSQADSRALGVEQSERLKKLNAISDSLSQSKDLLKLSPKEVAINKKININSAPIDELSLLPGIGNRVAARIIEYRNSHNRFKSIDELMKVKGIGEKKFDKLKDYVVVE
jgi:comEA protein